jgi:EAL domain-containing protein (putative c-di-GMP-specific phosphodiesterase class I)
VTHTLLHDILAQGGLTILFQPVFEMVEGRARLFALEALARGPKGSNVERADVLFEYVRRKGREAEVDRVCVEAVLASAATIEARPAISINVHASTLEQDDDFAAFLEDRCALRHLGLARDPGDRRAAEVLGRRAVLQGNRQAARRRRAHRAR